jgi:MEDS: MEthanogen/methylotroph, DcmR Sensory domain
MPGLGQHGESHGSHNHQIHFYDDQSSLATNVAGYLEEGLRAGEWVLVIATAEHEKALTDALRAAGLDPALAAREGRLEFRDAAAMLAQFMIDGQPDPARFENTVGAFIRELRARAGNGRVRAYGEMVDVLWNAGHSSAAIQLEQLWNQLLHTHPVSLLCAYQIDVFGKEFQTGVLDSILCAHTDLCPDRVAGDLDGAVNHAMSEVLGSRAEGLKLLMKANFRPSWPAIPHAEASVLWLRNNLPDYADEILARAKGHYQASLSAEHVSGNPASSLQ